MRRTLRWLMAGLGLAVASPAAGVTYVVTSTANAGPGTLRQAILDSNMSVDVFDIIEFDIDGPPFTIQPTAPLPTITDAVFIDGFSQDGSSPNSAATGAIDAVPLIELDGSLAGAADGLFIAHTSVSGIGSTVRGLVINNFATVAFAGIRLAGTPNHIIEGNFIGTDVSGLLARPNWDGIAIAAGADGSGVGGILPPSRNLISGNANHGIVLDTADNIVLGNLIGTDRSGVVGLGNGIGIELLLFAADNRIGDFGLLFSPSANTISGNLNGGVIIDQGSLGHDILGNRIGSGADGLTSLGNGSGPGVQVSGNGTTLVDNAIFGNSIGIALLGVTDTVVRANIIGLPQQGNVGAGVVISDSSNNQIGGTLPDGNVIAGNGGPGVQVIASAGAAVGNAILANQIDRNGGLGIELVNGANNDQPAPVLDGASGALNNRVVGSLSAAASTAYHIEFFASAGCDPSGFGEGAVLIGILDAATDGAGLLTFDETLSSSDGRPIITATATDPDGNTSQFSNCALNRNQIVSPAPALGHAALAGALALLIAVASLAMRRRAAR